MERMSETRWKKKFPGWQKQTSFVFHRICEACVRWRMRKGFFFSSNVLILKSKKEKISKAHWELKPQKDFFLQKNLESYRDSINSISFLKDFSMTNLSKHLWWIAISGKLETIQSIEKRPERWSRRSLHKSLFIGTKSRASWHLNGNMETTFDQPERSKSILKSGPVNRKMSRNLMWFVFWAESPTIILPLHQFLATEITDQLISMEKKVVIQNAQRHVASGTHSDYFLMTVWGDVTFEIDDSFLRATSENVQRVLQMNKKRKFWLKFNYKLLFFRFISHFSRSFLWTSWLRMMLVKWWLWSAWSDTWWWWKHVCE